MSLSSLLLLLSLSTLALSSFSPETHYTPKPLGIRDYFRSQNISASLIEGLAITFTPRLSIPFPLVIRTYMERLPHTWHVIVFTYNEKMDDKRALLSIILNGTVMPSRLHLLPLPFPLPSPRVFSCIVMSADFYQDLPTRWVLLFQMDTLILRRDDQKRDRSPNRYLFLRDFFSFPYLGAPWNFRHCSETPENPCRDGGNGGLTLRSRDFMINVTSNDLFVVQRHRKGFCENEDTALSDFMQGHYLSSLAPQSVRAHFSMETMFTRYPLGVHKPWVYIPHTMLMPLYKRCPDLELLHFLHSKATDEEKRERLRLWMGQREGDATSAMEILHRILDT